MHILLILRRSYEKIDARMSIATKNYRNIFIVKNCRPKIVVYLGDYVTVSAKIPRELREKLAEVGVKPSEVIRRALEEELEERTRKMLEEKVEKASSIISKVGREGWVKAVREGRDQR